MMKNIAEADLAEFTAQALVERLESGGWRYAILRNYEQFPKVSHDIDMVLTAHDVPRFRLLLVELAREHGWDALTECFHFGRSPVVEHNIEIFRFYRVSPEPAISLQVDVFHGFAILGLPLVDEEGLLQGRVKAAHLGLTHIDPSLENALRLLQVHRLMGIGSTARKVAAYVARVVGFAGKAQLRRRCRALLGDWAVRALEELERGKWGAFRDRMALARALFLGRRFRRNPVQSGFQVAARTAYIARTWFTDPCGEAIRVCAPEIESLGRLEHALERLSASRGVYAWTTGRGARRVLERGGAVVTLVHSRPQIDARGLSVEELERAILARLIARHPLLYLAPESPAC